MSALSTLFDEASKAVERAEYLGHKMAFQEVAIRPYHRGRGHSGVLTVINLACPCGNDIKLTQNDAKHIAYTDVGNWQQCRFPWDNEEGEVI